MEILKSKIHIWPWKRHQWTLFCCSTTPDSDIMSKVQNSIPDPRSSSEAREVISTTPHQHRFNFRSVPTLIFSRSRFQDGFSLSLSLSRPRKAWPASQLGSAWLATGNTAFFLFFSFFLLPLKHPAEEEEGRKAKLFLVRPTLPRIRTRMREFSVVLKPSSWLLRSSPSFLALSFFVRWGLFGGPSRLLDPLLPSFGGSCVALALGAGFPRAKGP